MASAHGRCPTCGFDAATVSPSDAAVAARSLPRRFRVALARPDDEEVPAEAVAAAAAAAEAMRQAAEALGRRPVPAAPDDVLEAVEAAAVALAEAIERTPSEEWEQPSALSTARAGVHAGVHHLRAARAQPAGPTQEVD